MDNLDHRLEEVEAEKEKNLTFFCDKLEYALVDIAFELEPQVKLYVDAKRRAFEAEISEKRSDNHLYVEKNQLAQKVALEVMKDHHYPSRIKVNVCVVTDLGVREAAA